MIIFRDDERVRDPAWLLFKHNLREEEDSNGGINSARVRMRISEDGWNLCKRYPKTVSGSKKKYKFSNKDIAFKMYIETFNDNVIVTLISIEQSR